MDQETLHNISPLLGDCPNADILVAIKEHEKEPLRGRPFLAFEKLFT
jgi:hypothetical protein